MNPHDLCHCGRKKDSRAECCSVCSRKSYPVGGFKFDKKFLRESVKSSRSYIELGKLLGVKRTTAKNIIAEVGLSVEHFRGCSRRITPIERILVKNCEMTHSAVRLRIKNGNVLEYKCQLCGMDPHWMGKPLSLELDHENGDRKDCRKENLRWLCPNCHSQTPTNKGKKRVR